MIFTQTREEFLETKKDTLGGSEVRVVLGNSPFQTRYSLWKLKSERTLKETNKFMGAGNMLEFSIIKEFHRKRELKVTETEEILACVDNLNSFLIVHPDFIWEKRLLEVKTTQKYLKEEEVPAFAMEHFYDQWNFTLGLLKEDDPEMLDVGFILILSRGIDYFEVPVKYNHNHFLSCREKMVSFYNLIKNGVAPEFSPADYDFIYNTSDGSSLKVDPELDDLIAKCTALSITIKELSNEEELLINTIKGIMKNHEYIVDDYGRKIVSWKTSKRGRIFRIFK